MSFFLMFFVICSAIKQHFVRFPNSVLRPCCLMEICLCLCLKLYKYLKDLLHKFYKEKYVARGGIFTSDSDKIERFISFSITFLSFNFVYMMCNCQFMDDKPEL